MFEKIKKRVTGSIRGVALQDFIDIGISEEYLQHTLDTMIEQNELWCSQNGRYFSKRPKKGNLNGC